MKILVCYDGSENAQDALNRTVEMFRALRPEVILLTVVDVPLDASIDSEDVFHKWKEQRHDTLQNAAKDVVAHGLDVDAILAIGDPREMILETVKEKNPDILVLGKRGGGGLTGMVLGSVSAYLVRHAKCPVLVFHQGGS